MAAKEPYDYLSSATPDYSTTILDLSSLSERLHEDGKKRQAIKWGSGRSVQSRNFSQTSEFEIEVDPSYLTTTQVGTIYNFYHNISKANGRMCSFRLTLPDGHTYAALFNSDMERVYLPTYQKLTRLLFFIIGKV